MEDIMQNMQTHQLGETRLISHRSDPLDNAERADPFKFHSAISRSINHPIAEPDQGSHSILKIPTWCITGLFQAWLCLLKAVTSPLNKLVPELNTVLNGRHVRIDTSTVGTLGWQP